jgi:hypothetical protein
MIKRLVHLAVISLIICIVASLVGMLALAGGLEQARSRAVLRGITNGEGELSDTELRFILIPAAIALELFSSACCSSAGLPFTFKFLMPTLVPLPNSSLVSKSTCPSTAFGRSRPAADATREVVERWLLDGLM